MSCQTCDTVLCHYNDEEIYTSPLYCQSCIDAAWTMSSLCEQHHKEGMTIEKMIMRIQSHHQFSELPMGTRETFLQVSRFDRRRNTEDNNYIRQLWSYLY